MSDNKEPYLYKFSVSALTGPEKVAGLKTLLSTIPAIVQVDVNLEKRLLRIVSVDPLEQHTLSNLLNPAGFHLEAVPIPGVPNPAVSPATPTAAQSSELKVCIDGMTCRSCELTIERKWKKMPGVKHVDVNAGTGRATLTVAGKTPTVTELQAALDNKQYHVHQNFKKAAKAEKSVGIVKRPSFARLVGLFALVFLVGYIFTSLGLLNTSFNIGKNMSFGAILIIGLVAASTSCIAVVGGLLLSASAKFNERYASAGPVARLRPVVLFVLGRIVSYTILGGVLGVVGAALSPSPVITAIIAISAALYMLIMGLDMLHIAPLWLKRCLPRMPKSLSHRIMDSEGKDHPLAPFGLGAATFFLPCGFTQALQLYALTTGSFTTGALTLLAFALGTAPALLALGWASSSLKGKLGRFFFQFSGALVVVLGLWNIQNGLTILGYPLSFPSLGDSSAQAQQASSVGSTTLSGIMEGSTQVIKMGFGAGGYSPSSFTLRAGVPVRWEVDGTKAGGCANVLISRELGVQKLLEPGINTIEFTPKKSGKIAFNCSMGMYRGSFNVLPAS